MKTSSVSSPSSVLPMAGTARRVSFFRPPVDSLRFSGALQPDFKTPRLKTTTQRLAGENIRVAWREFGNPDADNVIVCVHGFTRNSRDFDYLASQLAGKNCRVICPDIVGRGESGRFRSPLRAMKYNFPVYENQMTKLFDELKLNQKKVTWLGTSMGGVIGMQMAARKDTPIQRLILNDIGPSISTGSLTLLGDAFDGDDQIGFESIESAVPYFKARYAGVGSLSPSNWYDMTANSLRYDERAGLFRPDYDPAITEGFRWMHRIGKINPFLPLQAAAGCMLTNALMAHYWQSVRAPVLVLRGEHSPVLTRDTAEAMRRDHPDVTVCEIPDTAHAPALMSADQLAPVRDWLGYHAG